MNPNVDPKMDPLENGGECILGNSRCIKNKFILAILEHFFHQDMPLYPEIPMFSQEIPKYRPKKVSITDTDSLLEYRVPIDFTLSSRNTNQKKDIPIIRTPPLVRL